MKKLSAKSILRIKIEYEFVRESQKFPINPTTINTFVDCQVFFIFGRSKRTSEVSKRQSTPCKCRAFIIEDNSYFKFTFADYCKLVFFQRCFNGLHVKSILTHFQVLS